MILFAVKIIKVALPLLILGLVLLYTWQKHDQGKQSKWFMCRCCILWIILICAFTATANVVAELIPPLKDTIVVTALGENDQKTDTEEVLVQGFTVDGKDFPVCKPIKGKWFWTGDDMLCWRIETDLRQPEGVTRSITLEVPVGWSRTVNFKGGGINCGLVEIKTRAGTQTLDTYTEEATTISASLGRSSTSRLIWNQIRYLAVYAVMLAVLCAFAGWIFRCFLINTKKAKAWITENTGRLIYGCIALGAFFLMFRYANSLSLWYDELLAITFTDDSIGNAIKHCLELRELHPPMFEILATIWYHIAPYGEQWLLMICIVSCAISVYVVGLIGERIHNNFTGILAAVLCAVSTSSWVRQAYEYRPYALLMLFFTMTLYSFIRRSEEPKERRWHVLYSLSLLCMGMSDYFGMIVCAEFFCADIYLALRQKQKLSKKIISDYVIPGAICITWVMLVIKQYLLQDMSLSSWPDVPSVATIARVIKMLSGDIELLFWLSVVGIFLGIVGPLTKMHGGFSYRTFFRAICSWLPIITMLIPIMVAKLTGNDHALWVDRYFLLFIPCINIAIAYAAMYWIESSEKNQIIRKAALCFSAAVILVINCIEVVPQSFSEPYRDAADWIYNQTDIFYNNTAIYSPDGMYVRAGWEEYYLTRKNMRDDLNVCYSREELLNYDKVYVTYCHGKSMPSCKTLMKWLDAYYTLEYDNTAARVLVYVRKV